MWYGKNLQWIYQGTNIDRTGIPEYFYKSNKKDDSNLQNF